MASDKKPAEAQEPVAWQRRYKNHHDWFNISKHTYDVTITGKWAGMYDARELYAAPVAAASVVPSQEMLDAGIDALLAFRKSGGDFTAHPSHAAQEVLKAALAASTPAAPGIDLRKLTDSWLEQAERVSAKSPDKAAGLWACAKELRDWIDASPKGDASPAGQRDALLESLVARWRKDADEVGISDNTLCQKIANCKMRHAAELHAILAIPKGGSDAVAWAYTQSRGMPVGSTEP